MPHATWIVESAAAYDAASASSWGFDALHGPHHVALKQMREWGWVERKEERACGLESSCSVMVGKILFLD